MRWWWSDNWPLVVGACALAAFATFLVFAAIADDRQWEAYSAAHHCQAKGKQAGDIVVTSDGKTGVTFDKTIYVCDGGEIQIR